MANFQCYGFFVEVDEDGDIYINQHNSTSETGKDTVVISIYEIDALISFLLKIRDEANNEK